MEFPTRCNAGGIVSLARQSRGIKLAKCPKDRGDVFQDRRRSGRPLTTCGRAFGLRLSSRAIPVVLQHTMRHATISTTLKYYVGRDAQTAADVIHEAYRKAELGNVFGNIDHLQPTTNQT